MKHDDPLLTPPEGYPAHTDDVDEKLKRNLRLAQRTRWVLVTAVFMLLIGAVIFLSITAASQQRELAASCEVWSILAPQPVTVNPATGRPTPLSVSIIAAARQAYEGQHCGPPLSADPSVVKWARIFNIPLP